MDIYVIIESEDYDDNKITIATSSVSDAITASEKINPEHYAYLHVWKNGESVHKEHGRVALIKYLKAEKLSLSIND